MYWWKWLLYHYHVSVQRPFIQLCPLRWINCLLVTVFFPHTHSHTHTRSALLLAGQFYFSKTAKEFVRGRRTCNTQPMEILVCVLFFFAQNHRKKTSNFNNKRIYGFVHVELVHMFWEKSEKAQKKVYSKDTFLLAWLLSKPHNAQIATLCLLNACCAHFFSGYLQFACTFLLRHILSSIFFFFIFFFWLLLLLNEFRSCAEFWCINITNVQLCSIQTVHPIRAIHMVVFRFFFSHVASLSSVATSILTWN